MLVFASEPGHSKDQVFRFNKLTMEQGLSQSTVVDMVSDRYGYMWLATQDGLNRFDGKEVIVFQEEKNNPSSLSSSWIEKIIVDEDRIWVKSLRGLDSIDLKNLEITHWQDKIETHSFGEFDSRESGFKIYDIAFSSDKQLGVLTNHKAVLIDKSSGVISDYLNSIPNLQDHTRYNFTFDKTGNLYFLKNRSCLTIYYRNLSEPSDHCVDDERAFIKLELSDFNSGQITLASFTGFYLFDIKSKTFTHKEVFVGRTGLPAEVSDILELENGYWLATRSGVKFWSKVENKITTEYYSDSDSDYSLLNQESLSLAASDNGLIWVGNARGANFWNLKIQFEHLFRTQEVTPFKASNYVTTLIEDANENLWIGTNSSGLFRYSPNRALLENFTQYKTKEKTTDIGYVEVLYEDKQQNLWAASGAGLYIKSLNSDTFLAFDDSSLPIETKDTLKFINSISQDRSGKFWIGTTGGLYRLHPKYHPNGNVNIAETRLEDMKHLVPPSFLVSSTGIYTIYEDLQGYIWIGGNKGLIRLNPLNWKFDQFAHDPNDSQSLSNSDVNTIYEDFRGVLWVGTVAGLNRVKFAENGDIVFKRITTNDGFINDFICSILSDDTGNLWLSTANGLIKYHPDSQSIINYTYSDGLQYSEYYAKAQFSDGRDGLYFGGINGITYLQPSQVSYKKESSRVVITSVEQSDTLLVIDTSDEGDSVWVDDNAYVDINFSAFDYLNAHNLEFRYKVHGYSEEWLPLGNASKIRLHQLNQETLPILIQVRGADRGWSPLLTRLTINVRKTFFQSDMALALYVFLTLLAVSLFIYFIYLKIIGFLKVKDEQFSSEKAMNLDLIEENKSLDYQLVDLKYSVSEQLYQVEQLQTKVEQFEVSDQLTGFKNKNYIRANINQELSSIISTWNENQDLKGIHLGVFAIDIDNFDSIIKQYGILSGNEVLKQTAESLKTISYGTDTLVRWEGARLLILSRAIAKREQMLMAERVRNIIASRKFDLSNGANIDITCSIGFTRFPFIEKTDKPLTWEQLIYIAEQALEVAKINSKNAWVGIFSNRFTRRNEIERKLANDLPALIVSGQLDYISSIPKSKKLNWY